MLVTDIKHVFAQNPLYPVFREGRAAHSVRAKTDGNGAPSLPFLRFRRDACAIGHDGSGFAYDNEGRGIRRWFPPFRLLHAVTNGEYMAFIEDNGLCPSGILVIARWMTVNESASGGWQHRFTG